MDRMEPFRPPAKPARPKPFRSFADIVRRIEQVRAYTGLTKRRFCEAIGIRPQSYTALMSNHQGKPNLELIYGVVTRFRVNPAWVLGGRGNMFLDASDGQPGWTPAQARSPRAPVRVDGAQRPGGAESDGPLWQHLSGIVDRLDRRHRPLLERLMRVLHGHADANPVSAAGELQALLDFMEVRLTQR